MPIPGQIAYIQLIPRDFKNDPALAQIAWEPSIQHSEFDCPGCQRGCWIGPTQLAVTMGGAGKALCVYCLLEQAKTDPILRNVILKQQVVSLNPGIDRLPKRS